MTANETRQDDAPTRADMERVSLMTDDEVRTRLESDDVPDWFLHAVFLDNHVVDDETRRRVVQHPACPNTPLLTAQAIRPGWVADSPALALRRLRALESGHADDWDRRCERFRDDDLDDRSRSLYGYSVGAAHRLRSCPDFIVRDALDRGSVDTFRFIAKHGDARLCTMLLEQSNHHARRRLAARPTALNPELALALAGDRTISVRKTLAKRTDLDEPTATVLAADPDERVIAVLRANDKLPRRIARRLSDERSDVYRSQTTETDPDASIAAALALLEEERLETGTLVELARHPSPLIRHGAGAHAGASHAVYAAIMESTPVRGELWSYAPVARWGGERVWLETLLRSKDTALNDALAHNPHLPTDLCLELLGRFRAARLRAAVAAAHLDDPAVVSKVLETRTRSNGWEAQLEAALDPATKRGQLLKIHRHYEWRYLCVSRAIARHPACPPSLKPLFTHYLPADAAMDPQTALDRLGGEPVDSEPMRGWKVTQQLNDGVAHAFIANHYADGAYIEDARAAVDCRFLDDTILWALAQFDDEPLRRRLATRSVRPLPRFVQEMLARAAKPATRKLLASHRNLAKPVLQALCHDHDKSVAIAARVVAGKRGMKIASEVDKRSLRTLGTKPVRLDLAAVSTDVEVLVMLTGDKIADVRAAVARRTELPVANLLGLARDADANVRHAALRTLSELTLDGTSRATWQEILTEILIDDSPDRNMAGHQRRSLLALAARHVDDVALLERAYLEGRLDDNMTTVLDRTHSHPVLERALFEAERCSRPYRRTLDVIAGHPGLTVAQRKRVKAIRRRG